jgi:hypothetical protein
LVAFAAGFFNPYAARVSKFPSMSKSYSASQPALTAATAYSTHEL